MIEKIGFCMLLLARAAAFEMYDEHRAYPIDYQMMTNGDEDYEQNYDYQDLGPYRSEIRDDLYQSLLLYRLFNSLQNRDDATLLTQYRPKFSMIENSLAGYGQVPYSEPMDLKGAVVKRHAAFTAKPRKVKPEEPKDDVKKVRTGRRHEVSGRRSSGSGGEGSSAFQTIE